MNQIHVEALDTFPDLGLSFARMKLIDKLREVVPNSMYGCMIHYALDNHKPLASLLKIILEEYETSQHEVLNVIPMETIDLIKKIYKQ
jgi:hypothetical protein